MLGSTSTKAPPLNTHLNPSLSASPGRFKLIGLTGYSGVGKDVIASHLVQTYGYVRLGFGDALKEELAARFPKLLEIEAKEMYGHQISSGVLTLGAAIHELLWTKRTAMTRALLQHYGTDVRRADDVDYWVKAWCIRYLRISQPIVCPDVRFQNEADCIRSWGGSIYRIVRPGTKPLDHASDQQELEVDGVITNDKPLHELTIQENWIWEPDEYPRLLRFHSTTK